MACVIILRENIYDIVVSIDTTDKILPLYHFGFQMDASGEEPSPLNLKIFEATGSLWITSMCAIFKDEANFRKQFPNRRIPMRLPFHIAEKIDWSHHGIVYLGFRYFHMLVLSEGKDHLVKMSEILQDLFKIPTNSTDHELYKMMKHFMDLLELREKNVD
jgi:hypothetical protein